MRLYKLITLCICLTTIPSVFAEPPLNNVVLYGNVFLNNGTSANGATYNISVYDSGTGELLSTSTGMVGDIISDIIYESQNTPNSAGDIFNITVVFSNEKGEISHTITSEERKTTIVHISDMTLSLNSQMDDTVPPAITLTSPQNTTYTTSNIPLNISADETIETWWYSLNSDTNTTFTPNTTITALEGSNWLITYANDSAGNIGTAEIYFTVDSNPPNVIINSPQNTTYNVSDLWINATVWDSVNGSGSTLNVTAELDGTTNRSLTNTSDNWNYLWTNIADGQHYLTIYTNDSAGNMNDAEIIYFTVDTTITPTDTTSPDVTIVSPTNATYSSFSQVVNVSVTDTQSSVVGVVAEVDGSVNVSLVRDGGTDYYDTTYTFSEGQHYVTVYANDSAGNMNDAVTVYFTVDTVLPTITVDSPLATRTYTAATVNLKVSADESIDVWMYSLNGAANVTFTPNTTITGAEGSNTIKVYANDSAGNMDHVTVTFTVATTPTDTTSPDVTLVSPQNTTYSSFSQVVNVSVTDTQSSVVGVMAEVDGSVNVSLVRDGGTDYYDTTYAFSEGQHYVRIYANDSAGNMNDAVTVYFTVDTVLPTITVDSPMVKMYTATTVDLKVSADESIDVWMYSLNGAVNVTFTPNTTITGAEGSNTIKVYANDSAGNMDHVTVTFTIAITPTDTTSPDVTIVSPTNATYSSFSQVINASVTDAQSSIVGVIAEVDGSVNISLVRDGSTDYYAATYTFSEGQHYLRIYANDSAGNMNDAGTVYFTVDTSPPYEITLNYPQNNANIFSQDIIFRWTAYDNISTQLWFNLTIDGSVIASSISTISGTEVTSAVSGLSEGTHNWSVTSWDPASGANTSVTYYFTVDKTPPAVSLITPDKDTNLRGSVYINVTAADVTTGVYTVSVQTTVGGNWIELTRYGGSISEGTWSYLWDTTQAMDGSFTLTINATDFAGVSNATVTRSVSVDNTAPLITNPPDMAVTQGSTESISWVIIDDNAGKYYISKDSAIVKNTTPYTSGSQIVYTVDTSNTGSWNYTIIANDTLGNMAQDRVTVTISGDDDGGDDGNGGGGGGGGGGGDGSPGNIIGGGVNPIVLGFVKELIIDLGLLYKRFYRMPRSLAATFVVTGGVTGEYPAPSLEVQDSLSTQVTPLTGNVYELAAENVLKKYTSADTLFIIRGDKSVDSMASIAYASSEDIPILLTKPSDMPASTLRAIQALGPNKIIIVGGGDAVSEKVETELGKLATIRRIGGKTRYETAIELAKTMDKPSTIIITDGENPSIDAAIIAGGYKAPIIYVNGDKIPQNVRAYLLAHRTVGADNTPTKIVLAGLDKGAQEKIKKLMGS